MMPRAIRELMRPDCTECRSSFLAWARLDSLAFELSDLEDRKYAAELIGVVGGDADAWKCLRCGAFGAFVDVL